MFSYDSYTDGCWKPTNTCYSCGWRCQQHASKYKARLFFLNKSLTLRWFCRRTYRQPKCKWWYTNVCVELAFLIYLESGPLLVIRESNASKVVDNGTCEWKSFIFGQDWIRIFSFTDGATSSDLTNILICADSTEKIDEEEGEPFTAIERTQVLFSLPI